MAGLILWRTGPAAALGVAAVALAAAVLVPLHLWQPLVALPVVVVALALGWRLVLRVPWRPAPVWAVALTVLIAVGFTVWAAWTHSEHVVLRRDNGSYALFAQWLATRHGLPVDASLHAFGGPAALGIDGVTFDSPAYFQVLTHGGVDVVPQFLLGAPALFSLGWWATGGWAGLLLVPALLAGLGLVAAGSLTARLVGPRWAPLAVAVLALAQPVVMGARTTFSEIPALILVLGAAAVAVDAVERDAPALGWIAGALAGLAGLVRVDSLREVVLLVPLCAVLLLRGSRAAVSLGAGALAGTLVAAVPAVALSRPYLESVSGSLVPLVAAGFVLIGGSVLAVLGVRILRRRRPPRPGQGEATGVARVLPWLAAAAVAVVCLYLVARPAFTVVRQSPDDPGSIYVASLQRSQGLPVDGARTYAEQSVTWVAWFLGWPAVVLGAVTLTALAVPAVRWWARRDGSPAPGWLVPAAVGLGSTVLTLYRPGITPDHPWADRRLVVTVLPTVALAAVAAVAWAVRTARRRAPAVVLGATGVAGVALLVVPAAIATAPLARASTERGEVRAVKQVCEALSPTDAVVVLGSAAGGSSRATNEWPQVVRGVCAVPAVSLETPVARLPAALDRLSALAARAGHRIVLLTAADTPPRSAAARPPAVLTALGVRAERATRVVTREPPRLLTRRAAGTVTLLVEVWTAPWPPA